MDDKDRVMVELDAYLDTLEEDYIDPAERKREMAERAADEAICNEWFYRNHAQRSLKNNRYQYPRKTHDRQRK